MKAQPWKSLYQDRYRSQSIVRTPVFPQESGGCYHCSSSIGHYIYRGSKEQEFEWIRGGGEDECLRYTRSTCNILINISIQPSLSIK